MLSVIITLIPAVAFSVYQFGLYVLAMYIVSVATCFAVVTVNSSENTEMVLKKK